MSDQLVYKVKFEADEKSLNDIRNALDAIEKQRGAKSGGSAKSETEKEVSALKELKKELKEKQEQLAKVNKSISEGNNVTLSMIANQKQLGSELQTVSQKIQEATRGYVDQNTALSKTPQTLNELIEKQRALKIALSDVDTKSEEFKQLTKEYANTTAQIKELKSAMVLGSAEVRQFGTTLADLKLEQKTLATAIENTPIVEQSDRLDKLRKAHQEVTARINEFTKSQQNSSTAQKEATSDTDKSTDALSNLRQQLKAKQQDLANLQQGMRDGSISSDDLRAKQGELGASISELRTQVQDATRGYLDQDTVLATTATTYNELTQQNRALSIAMRDIPLDDTTGRLQALQEQYAQNNVKLKDFDKSLGNSQRNVGNYDDSIRSAANALAIFQGPLGPIAGRINALATFLSRLNSQQEASAVNTKAQTVATATHTQTTRASTTATVSSIAATQTQTVANTANTASIKLRAAAQALLTSAIIATGIGVSFVAIGVMQFMTRTEEGQQRARVAAAGFRAEIDTMRETIIKIGKITAIDRFLGSFTLGLGKMRDANLQAREIQENLNRLLIIERRISVQRSEMNRNLAETRALVRDERTDIESRIKALNEINEKEESLANREQRIAESRLRLFKERRGMFSSDEEQMQAVVDQEIILNKIAEENAVREQNFVRQSRALRRELSEFTERVNREEFDAKQKLDNLELQERIANLRRRGEIERAFALERESIGKDADERIRRAADAFMAATPSMKDEQAIALARTKVNAEIAEERAQFENRHLEHTRNIASAIATNDLDITRRTNQLRLDERTNALEREGSIVEANILRLNHVELLQAQEIERRKNDLIRSGYDATLAQDLASSQVIMENQEELANARTELFQSMIQRQLAIRDLNFQEEQTLSQIAFNQEINQHKLKNNQLAILQAELGQIGLDEEQRIQDARLALIAQGISAEEDLLRSDNIIRAQIAQERANKEQDIERQKTANLRQMTDLGMSIFKNAGEAIFGNNKALAVSGALMDTYAAATRQLKDLPAPMSYLSAAAITATGMANVRKIMAVKKSSSAGSSGGSSAPSVSTSFGLVDVGTNPQPFAFNMATGAQPMNAQSMQPTFVFQGDLDPSFMAIKVTQGNNEISSQATGV